MLNWTSFNLFAVLKRLHQKMFCWVGYFSVNFFYDMNRHRAYYIHPLCLWFLHMRFSHLLQMARILLWCTFCVDVWSIMCCYQENVWHVYSIKANMPDLHKFLLFTYYYDYWIFHNVIIFEPFARKRLWWNRINILFEYLKFSL